MPKVTVYIRNEDLVAWKAISHKTEFIHASLQGDGYVELKKRPQVMNLIKEPKDVITVVTSKPHLARAITSVSGLCKIHGIPLDTRGKCLQKGCKYS